VRAANVLTHEFAVGRGRRQRLSSEDGSGGRRRAGCSRRERRGGWRRRRCSAGGRRRRCCRRKRLTGDTRRARLSCRRWSCRRCRSCGRGRRGRDSRCRARDIGLLQGDRSRCGSGQRGDQSDAKNERPENAEQQGDGSESRRDRKRFEAAWTESRDGGRGVPAVPAGDRATGHAIARCIPRARRRLGGNAYAGNTRSDDVRRTPWT
jgi:hypothetical protein